MNTLTRVDAFFASLGHDAALSAATAPSPSAASTPYSPPPVAPGSAVSSASAATSLSSSPASAATTNMPSIVPAAAPTLEQCVPLASRRLSNLPPRARRRRHRRRPTGSSIKLPPPTTPLLVRFALAIWSILLSFWRSLVGDTRAVRDRRRGPAGKLLASVLPEADGHRVATAPVPNAEPSVVSGEPVSASSDEGSGSDLEPSDREWVDPVTRAPEGPTPSISVPSDSEFQSRTPTDATFSFRLRSARNKETISITGAVDVAQGSDTTGDSACTSIVTHAPPFAPLTRHTTPPSILQPRRRLLPNPMVTSLLDPSVPAVPHRSVTPTIVPPPRPHHTPFHLQKTLILDLDETLIHSTSRPIGAAHAGGGMLGLHSGLFGGSRRRRGEGHTVEVVLNGRSTTYHVYKRPYVDFFLKKVASWYRLVIFTASMPEYADPVIDWLDNGRGLFAKRLYRESCYLQRNGSYIKDLADVEPDLSKVCFMDNSPISYSWNKANALPIEGWTSDPNDEALLQSIPVLDSLRFVTDVRHILGIRGFT